MITTFEIILICLAVILFFFMVFGYIVSYRYKKYQDGYVYTRGANTVVAGSKVTLVCDGGKKIHIDKATQICSVPTENNFEGAGEIGLEPISNGLEGNVEYGMFNPDTTVDLVEDMKEKCDGKDFCEYTFEPKEFIQGKTCPKDNTQLIATYVCKM